MTSINYQSKLEEVLQSGRHKQALIEILIMDHGLTGCNLIQTFKNSDKTMYCMSHDSLNGGVGHWLFIESINEIELHHSIQKLIAHLGMTNLKINVLHTQVQVPNGYDPRCLELSKGNFRISASYFKNRCLEHEQVLFMTSKFQPEYYNLAIPDFLVGGNQGIMMEFNGYQFEPVPHKFIKNTFVNCFLHPYTPQVRAFMNYLKAQDWSTINFLTKQPGNFIQDNTWTSRNCNLSTFAVQIERICLPGDKLAYVNCPFLINEIIRWESETQPKEQNHNKKQKNGVKK